MLASFEEPRHFIAPTRVTVGRDGYGPEGALRTFPARMVKNPAPRVLVVDDESLLRWSLAEMLAAAGYDVIEARDGSEARRALNDGTPVDAIVLDLKLPDTTGLSLIDEIQRRGLRCPMVLMTAYGTADTVERALTAGVTRVVSKPFDLDDMVRFVRQVCPLPEL
jgi:DNA-binding NtrC family response regulator